MSGFETKRFQSLCAAVQGRRQDFGAGINVGKECLHLSLADFALAGEVADALPDSVQGFHGFSRVNALGKGEAEGVGRAGSFPADRLQTAARLVEAATGRIHVFDDGVECGGQGVAFLGDFFQRLFVFFDFAGECFPSVNVGFFLRRRFRLGTRFFLCLVDQLLRGIYGLLNRRAPFFFGSDGFFRRCNGFFVGKKTLFRCFLLRLVAGNALVDGGEFGFQRRLLLLHVVTEHIRAGGKGHIELLLGDACVRPGLHGFVLRLVDFIHVAF